MIFSWGANSHGQLGLSTVNEQVEKAHQVLIDSALNAVEVKQVACGGGHTLLLDIEGKLFSCGWNHKLQLGTDKECSSFERVWNLGGIVFTNIACGWDFSCGVTDDNFLFVWGSNSNGELGLPKDHFPEVVKPFRLQVNACEVSMGLRHTAIINSKGEVWITGCGRHGQLGLGDELKSSDRFQQVPKLGKISHIACGQNHTTAWCSDEKALYVWGDNRHGQLLLDKEKYKKVFTAQKIDIGVKQGVKKLLSGWTNSLLWLENGTLITWGRNNYGQLGTDENICGKLVHVKIPDGKEIKDIALGSEHTICLMTDNSLWAWGWNEHANTATKLAEPFISNPTLVDLDIDPSLCITQIYAGSAHNFIVTKQSETSKKESEKTENKAS
ncbi:ultraviolet-B receptor UVR8-like [Ostrinia furnacalis]|uniref:ultraviolet-B receptor UVR8-like n=1 Tax=Ostrinia furnacalis TaxID=93504 RepID=UPI00103E5EFD|nr:ultraviolet-B receptor UVR8-like [Ostrinia furnacalis]